MGNDTLMARRSALGVLESVSNVVVCNNEWEDGHWQACKNRRRKLEKGCGIVAWVFSHP